VAVAVAVARLLVVAVQVVAVLVLYRTIMAHQAQQIWVAVEVVALVTQVWA
jgi:hypothetical protein